MATSMMHPREHHRTGAKVVCFATFLLLAACGISEDEPWSVYKEGAPIIAALEQYRCDHKIYPKQLNQLMPDYLSRITPPDWGARAWRYSVNKEGQFSLIVGVDADSGYPCVYYEGDGWFIDQ